MSTINKINYEQFALDYLEGNLSGKMLEEMKVFLEKNPDISKELEEMELFYLESDDDITFQGKEDLLKPVSKPKGIIIQPAILLVGLFVFLLCLGGGYTLMNNTFSNNQELEIATDNKKTDKVEENKIIVTDEIKENIEIVKDDVQKEEVPTKKEPLLQSPKNIQTKEDKDVLIIDENTPIANQIPKQPTISPTEYISPNNITPEYNNPSQPLFTNEVEEVIVHQVEEKPKDNLEINPTPISFEIKPIDISNAIVSIEGKQEEIQLVNTIQIAEFEFEEEIEETKQSRLSKLGLFPERKERKINLRTIKDALTPEVFASRD